MNDLGQRIAKLSPEKRAALESYLIRKGASALREQGIPRREPSASCILSFAQQRLWFLDQLEPNSSLYNIPKALRIRGRLDIATLQKTLNTIVQRHESLRTTFASDDGIPVQIVASNHSVNLPAVDLSNLPASEREEEVQRLLKEGATQPFDLSQDLMLRATLLRLGQEDYVLLLVVHHIASDGWSMGVLFRELAALYEAYSAGKPSPLPELPIQYADFALWQHGWLQGEVLDTQLGYWREKLKGAPPVLELPTDWQRPAIQSYVGKRCPLALSAELTKSLKALSRENGCTLFMVLLAAFDVLLYRYSGQEDMVAGTVIANRNRVEIEDLIGFFVNTLVLRTDLSGEPSFAQLLSRVREVCLQAYAHQDLPFEKLVEELHPERDMSRTPLFQAMFVLQNAPRIPLELPGLSITPLELKEETAKFDLTLSMSETRQMMEGFLEYNVDLFEAATIERMASHYQTLLEGIVTDPEQRIWELPLLTAVERHQMLVEWNDTRADYPRDRSIHGLFEEQVQRTPDAVALVSEGSQMTYRELNSRANQLAHYLQKLGVGPESLVGICMERCLDLVVGLLGILKAGGAYVPMDPMYPEERLAFMLEDSKVSVLLTQRRLMEGLPDHAASAYAMVCLDSDWSIIAAESPENPVSEVRPVNLAYVIYTSGSTGKPKGVMITHTGLLNLVFWHQRVFAVTSSDRVTQLAGAAFDASGWELWPYLAAGARVYLVESELLSSPVNLRDWLISKDITISFLPTPLAVEMLFLEWPAKLALRIMLTGGDKLNNYPSALIPFQLVNNYGPTENTVVTTSGPVALTRKDISPPIGRPIANTRVYILDTHLQPVPIGVRGELHISGDGLARGYLNQPELTGERFIPNPFSQAPGARLYKTGDMVRYLPDGNIEFLGRLDFQTKIRGFRIELGEVEAVLSGHPSVREVAVLAREDIPGDRRLVAYVVPDVVSEQGVEDVSGLRQFLKEKLPEYMIPSAFVKLQAMPITSNGKVDREALPAPDRSWLGKGYVSPLTHAEKVLAGIWSEVLRVQQVGIHDNFFELGGDSILSIQIVARANRAGLHITPKQLFQHQTIAELASVAGIKPAVQAEQGLVTGTVSLTPVQRWFFEQALPEPHHYNMSFLLEVSQGVREEVIEQVLRELLVHHDALRLRFKPTLSSTASGWEQYNAGLDAVAEGAVLSTVESLSEVAHKASELQASLNFTEGPLMRVALFRVSRDEPCRLLLVIHHLAVDGVSWRILLEDISSVYQQIERGEAIRLPTKTTSFKEWANRLLEYAKTEEVDAELEYWMSRQSSGVFRFPVDYPSGKEGNTVASSSVVSLSLSVEQTRALLREVLGFYKAQINDVLLTALIHSFSRWTGSNSLMVDLEGHGREDIFEDVDLSRTVGWFTTIFPVVLEHQGGSQPYESLSYIKEQLHGIPNHGIGYGILRYLRQDTSVKLQSLPRAEVSFNYLGQYDQSLMRYPLLGLAKESSEPNRSPKSRRQYLLEVRGVVVNDMLQMNWIYSGNIHRRTTVERLAGDFMEALESIIRHCQTSGEKNYMPSDFPDVKLSQEKLNSILEEVGLADDESISSESMEE